LFFTTLQVVIYLWRLSILSEVCISGTLKLELTQTNFFSQLSNTNN